jgi:beta-lactamase regulating signal transducer with metallopeptidase domain
MNYLMDPNGLSSANALAATGANVLQRACWTSGLLVLIVLGVCRLFPRLPHAARCGLWWLTCLKFVLSLAWTTPLLLPILPAVPTASIVPTPFAVPHTGLSRPLPMGRMAARPLSPASGAASTPASEIASALPTPTPIVPSFALVCLAVWLIGVIARLFIVCWQVWHMRRLVNTARVLHDRDVERIARETALAMGLCRLPRLLVTDNAEGPLALGLFQPTVLLCRADLDRLTHDELHTVLAHEFAHIRRGDLWRGLVPHAAHILFWFHPLVWLAYREFDMAREADCDARALRSIQTPFDAYAQLLVKLGTTNHSVCIPGALGAQSHFRTLQRRILMLKHTPGETRIGLIGLLGLFSVIGLAGLIPWRLIAAPQPARPAHASKVVSPLDPTILDLNALLRADWNTIAAKGPENLDFAQGLAHWQRAVPEGDAASTDAAYQVLMTDGSAANGQPGAYLTARGHSENGMLLVQRFRADAYRAKRVRFSAMLKSADLKEPTGLMLMLDTPDAFKGRASDTIGGTTDWKRLDCVIDVPTDCRGLILGTGMAAGKGKLWFRDVHFDVVGNDVALTPEADDRDGNSSPDWAKMPAAPVNLDLSDGLRHWEKITSPGDKAGYQQTVVRQSGQAGNQAQIIGSITKAEAFGGIMQNVRASAYRGKRIRYSAQVRTQGTVRGAMAFLRIDRRGAQRAWNYPGAAICIGTTGWKTQQYVLDVPNDAEGIAFGLFTNGKGTTWARNFRFEVVGTNVPVSPAQYDSDNAAASETDEKTGFYKQPQNLNFVYQLTDWGNDNPEHNATKNYAIGLDAAGRRSGQPSAWLKSIVEKPQSYGTLMQNFSAEKYRGKRLRYSAWLRTQAQGPQSGEEGAGLWIVLHDDKHGAAWNMTAHPIQGTTGWKRYTWVLDVPPAAKFLSFGIDLTGKGKVWVDDFRFELVGTDVPLTPPTEN